MTTLADMTPEQRAQCVGMWCDFLPGDKDHGEPEQGIFAYWNWVKGEAVITFPALADTRKWAHPENVTPRYDLPRAWNPDGTPVSAKWEYQLAHENEKVARPFMQRHVTEWEPLGEE